MKRMELAKAALSGAGGDVDKAVCELRAATRNLKPPGLPKAKLEEYARRDEAVGEVLDEFKTVDVRLVMEQTGLHGRSVSVALANLVAAGKAEAVGERHYRTT